VFTQFFRTRPTALHVLALLSRCFGLAKSIKVKRRVVRGRRRHLDPVQQGLVLVLIAGLTACGGGGGGGTPGGAPSGAANTPVATPLSLSAVMPSANSTTKGGAVTFAATCSGGVPSYSYQWNFGDGSTPQTTSAGTVTHVYMTVATNQVTATCSDSAGQTATAPGNVSISVFVPPPAISGLSVSPTAPLDTSPVAFTVNCSSSYATSFSYLWNFGDGSAPQTTAAGAVSHNYASGGNYGVSVSCTDTADNVTSSTATLSVAVGIPAPTVTTALAVRGRATTYLTTLTVACAGAGGGPWSYVWNFGDGSPNQTTNTGSVTHQYAAWANYLAHVSCDDGSGTPANSSVSVNVVLSSLVLLSGQAGGDGNLDLRGPLARFSYPMSVAANSAGDIYVSEFANNWGIRKINSLGDVSSLPTLLSSSYVAVDSSGNLYSADGVQNVIRKLTPTGVMTVLAGSGAVGSGDGPAAAASFKWPSGVALDAFGNVYVTDTGNGTIRKITPAGVVATLAGTAGVSGSADGTGAAASFNGLGGIATDKFGNLYVADTNNNTVRKITPVGVVTTLAGTVAASGSADGTGPAAQFAYPVGVATDSSGIVYVSDRLNHTIRKISPTGVVTTLAGWPGVTGASDGAGTVARFNSPMGITIDSADNLYVADYGNDTIRKITPSGNVSTVAGSAPGIGSTDGSGTLASFNQPYGVATDSIGNVYVADTWNSTIRKIDPAGQVTTFAGTARPFGYILGTDGTGAAASFTCPHGVATDRSGYVYVADTCNNTIRKITPAGVVTTLAGTAGLRGSVDGYGAAARFNNPQGVAVDGAGNVYVSDTWNFTIRKIAPDGLVTTFAGTAGSQGSADGIGAAATFTSPESMATDGSGNLFVVDSGGVRKITSNGKVTRLPYAPSGPAITAVIADDSGNLYEATNSSEIYKIAGDGVVTKIAGDGYFRGFAEGALPGILNLPRGLAFYGSTLYIANTRVNSIAKIINVP
jgi:sugar lactone lactonase YvrE